jgi:uncharacterized protein (TIGR02594 family)
MDTPWLDDMLADIGVREIKGAKANEKILAYFAEVGHSECQSDEIAWCAARVGAALKRSGLPIPPVNVNLLARSYLTYGTACEPKPGAIVIFRRGNSTWQGHVGVVTEVVGDRVKYVAGNQGNQVGYDEHSIKGALGFRWPVMPTVPELRKAGSTEIRKGDQVQNAGWLVTLIPSVIAAVNSLFGKLEVPQFADVKEGLSWWQEILGGANAVAGLVLAHPWLAGTCLVGALLILIGHQLKAARVAKAAAGVPLSSQVA